MEKTLVAYFSATGVTRKVSEHIAKIANADLYEIKPAVPYTVADLDWLDKNARSTIEMQNLQGRPEIIKEDVHLENYDTILLGFPIWWYVAPTVINTFLEANDFSHKKIVLFATSGGSKFGRTVAHLRMSIPDSTKLIEGKIITKSSTVDDLEQWVKSLE